MKSAWPPARNAVGRTARHKRRGPCCVGDLLDRSFLDRSRMLLQLLEESFAQLGGLDKKIALGAIIGDEHGTIEDILVYNPAAAGGGRSEKSGGIG
jgi:hypothetical protein